MAHEPDGELLLGETIILGSHLFTASEIKRFAEKYDPQPFHVDEKAAEESVFGRLCASGWHTCAMWMRYNLQDLARRDAAMQDTAQKLGPSPGFSNLKWLKAGLCRRHHHLHAHRGVAPGAGLAAWVAGV